MIPTTVSEMQAATAFHPDFGAQVRYEFTWLPDDPDAQVSCTIAKLCRYLLADAQSPIIGEFAGRALELGQGDPILGCWHLIKSSLRFQQDEASAARLHVLDPRIKDVVEVLIRPVDQALLIKLRGQGFEDCDGFELFGGCLLYRMGIPCSLVTVSAEPEEPNRFTHVYIAAYPQGREGPRVPLDFSHGAYPGWECPNAGRLKEWPIGPYYYDHAGLALSFAAILLAYISLKIFNRKGLYAD